MAIRIQHGPIGTAARLASEGGRAVAADRELAMRRQLASEHATRLQAALKAQQLQQQERMGAAEEARRRAALAAEQQYRQQSLGLRGQELGLRAAGLQEERRQFNQRLPIEQMRAKGYLEQAKRGRQRKPITDPTKLPAWKKAEAARVSRQRRIEALERQYEEVTEESALGRRVPKAGMAQQAQQLRQQMAEIGGEIGKIVQEQQKLADEFEVGQQIDGQMQEAAAVQQEADDEFDQQVREIEAKLSEDASIQKIMDTVILEYGTPNDQQEAQELADIVNAVERKLRGR
jgi:hypothetical protein